MSLKKKGTKSKQKRKASKKGRPIGESKDWKDMTDWERHKDSKWRDKHVVFDDKRHISVGPSTLIVHDAKPNKKKEAYWMKKARDIHDNNLHGKAKVQSIDVKYEGAGAEFDIRLSPSSVRSIDVQAILRKLVGPSTDYLKYQYPLYIGTYEDTFQIIVKVFPHDYQDVYWMDPKYRKQRTYEGHLKPQDKSRPYKRK